MSGRARVILLTVGVQKFVAPAAILPLIDQFELVDVQYSTDYRHTYLVRDVAGAVTVKLVDPSQILEEKPAEPMTPLASQEGA